MITLLQLRDYVDWFLTHKAGIGGVIVAVAGVPVVIPGHHHGWDIALAIGTALVGGGLLKSDPDTHAKLKWEKHGEERRLESLPPGDVPNPSRDAELEALDAYERAVFVREYSQRINAGERFDVARQLALQAVQKERDTGGHTGDER